ncbi:MAG: CD3324 family protein [Clostridiaceae bacterium]|nr:CD3324 family protein [Clostridiaceae bacterium]
MKYEKAQDILPDNIIKLIQEYTDGKYIYIPRKSENKKSWGESSGAIKSLKIRNKEIYKQYIEGKSVNDLCNMYFLSEASIRRIIRENKISV